MRPDVILIGHPAVRSRIVEHRDELLMPGLRRTVGKRLDGAGTKFNMVSVLRKTAQVMSCKMTAEPLSIEPRHLDVKTSGVVLLLEGCHLAV